MSKHFKESPRFYRRNLPHLQPEDGVFFITYTLNGALPTDIYQDLKAERELKIKELKKEGLSPEEIKTSIRNLQEFYFGKYDSFLDNSSHGPRHLEHPLVSKLVKDSLHWMDGKAYKLVCYIIMCNHVHKIVYKTRGVLWKLMKQHKSYTGKEANKVLGLTGPFWQHESFDHCIRNREWLAQKIQYTLKNAQNAGLVKHWNDYPHCWIRPEFEKYVNL